MRLLRHSLDVTHVHNLTAIQQCASASKPKPGQRNPDPMICSIMTGIILSVCISRKIETSFNIPKIMLFPPTSQIANEQQQNGKNPPTPRCALRTTRLRAKVDTDGRHPYYHRCTGSRLLSCIRISDFNLVHAL